MYLKLCLLSFRDLKTSFFCKNDARQIFVPIILISLLFSCQKSNLPVAPNQPVNSEWQYNDYYSSDGSETQQSQEQATSQINTNPQQQQPIGFRDPNIQNKSQNLVTKVNNEDKVDDLVVLLAKITELIEKMDAKYSNNSAGFASNNNNFASPNGNNNGFYNQVANNNQAQTLNPNNSLPNTDAPLFTPSRNSDRAVSSTSVGLINRGNNLTNSPSNYPGNQPNDLNNGNQTPPNNYDFLSDLDNDLNGIYSNQNSNDNTYEDSPFDNFVSPNEAKTRNDNSDKATKKPKRKLRGVKESTNVEITTSLNEEDDTTSSGISRSNFVTRNDDGEDSGSGILIPTPTGNDNSDNVFGNNRFNSRAGQNVRNVASGNMPANNKYVVQLATMRQRDDLAEYWKQLSSIYKKISSYTPLVMEVNNDKGRYFHLRAGPINSYQEAQNICSELNSVDINCIVSTLKEA